MALPSAELKDRLKKALSIRDMRPVDLSEKTDIPKSAISQYMSGYTKPKSDRLYLIASALNISEAWLLGYNVPMEKEELSEDDAKLDLMISEDKELKEVLNVYYQLSDKKQKKIRDFILFIADE